MPEFSYYAEMNVLRSQFTILSKMKLYGYEKSDLEVEKQYNKLRMVVRKNFVKLFKWHMPFSRKILLIIVCI